MTDANAEQGPDWGLEEREGLAQREREAEFERERRATYRDRIESTAARRLDFIQISLTHEEQDRIMEAAAHRKQDVASYVRDVVFRDIDAMLGKQEDRS